MGGRGARGRGGEGKREMGEGREKNGVGGGEREHRNRFYFLFSSFYSILERDIWSSLLRLFPIKSHSTLEQCIGCQHEHWWVMGQTASRLKWRI